ncbi:unknown [Haloarcula marismortui ATCC 43049]|uniref:Bacteriocin biosynthesis protein SagD n=1 Tax=Haloarcula marismortui (strain ATCC 43049 / DSM 3752 / JCM 8966 / VKM B-1809) TaxID=272569 RepID=Q5V3D4_HALMA|nr:YcaO-like family protein [Haloarcula marismortui]AAV45968.1 unknown [Haloarcula marismortui ATCC 43049]QCP90738.1 bacteriocin biosynthesis protein SagD [Haloarcula marismortui ATCC 43049]
MRTVEVVGRGPAVDALAAFLADIDVSVAQPSTPADSSGDLAIVVDTVGSERFAAWNDRAKDDAIPWVAVELGGVGGVPVTDAAISGFGPETGCFDCLRTRVEATVDDTEEVTGAPAAATQRFAGALAGRLVTQFLDGDAALLGTVTELPHTQRRFLPVPGCDCGGTQGHSLGDGRQTAPDSEALSRAELGLDDRVGIATEVGEVESFPAPYYLSTLADTAGFSDVSAAAKAAGVAIDWDTAFMKALGENYERYAAGVYREGNLQHGTVADVPAAVTPDTFVRDEAEWDESHALPWVPAENLLTDEQRSLPAETVHYPPPSNAVRPATTTGLGLGNTVTEALLTGLYEVIERDAAMLSWYSTFDPLRVAIDEHEQYETLRRRATSEGLDVTALLLTQDVDVPVITVALAQDEWPRFALGTDADLNPGAAAVGALEEALQNWMELDSMGPEAAMDAQGAIGRYAKSPGEAADLTASETAVPLDSLGPDVDLSGEAELETLCDRAADAGLAPYGTRLTTRDLEQLGFEAVRVVCPSAQPLFFGESFFGERAETVPADLGFEPRLDRDHHPFP